MHIETIEMHLDKFHYQTLDQQKGFKSEKIPSDFKVTLTNDQPDAKQMIEVQAKATIDFVEQTYRVAAVSTGRFKLEARYLKIMGQAKTNAKAKSEMDALVKVLYETLMERVRIYSGLFSMDRGQTPAIPPLAVLEDGILSR